MHRVTRLQQRFWKRHISCIRRRLAEPICANTGDQFMRLAALLARASSPRPMNYSPFRHRETSTPHGRSKLKPCNATRRSKNLWCKSEGDDVSALALARNGCDPAHSQPSIRQWLGANFLELFVLPLFLSFYLPKKCSLGLFDMVIRG